MQNMIFQVPSPHMKYYLMDQANRADLVAGLGLAPEGRVKHGSRHQKKHPCDGKYRLLRNNKKMLLSNFF